MSWIIMALAIIGTLLVTSQSRKVRLAAFIIWALTNPYWIIVAVDPALKAQFAIYFGLAILGIWNNRKDIVR